MKRLIRACLALVAITGCESYDVVMAGLPQAEANEALVLLRERHIDAKKQAEPSKKIALFQIMVKRSESLQALKLLVEQRIPRVERAGLKDIYPPGAGGLIPTKSEEHARFLMASQGEIEALFKIIPGIKDARVVLSFDPPSEIFKNATPKTASVVLLYQSLAEDGSPPLSELDAKLLIAASITGLGADDVTVVQKPLAQNTATQAGFADGTSLTPRGGDSSEKNIVWYMLALTILALVVATYGVFRLFMQRRARVV